MSKRSVYLTPLLLGAGLVLPGAMFAQINQTLPVTRVTANAESEGAGEGDLDETTLSPEDLERFGVETLEDLSALAPNLHFVDSDTRGYGNIISMRGVSNTLFFGPAAVGLYIDDVPFSDAFTYSSNLLRLESARVHHGPQGASFGANASGGLINLTTMQAGDKWQYGGSAEYGSYNSKAVSVYSAGPLAEGLSHTFQLYWKERDGFVKNRFLGDHVDDRSILGGLATIVWTPTDDTEIKVRVMAEKVDDGAQRLSALPQANLPPAFMPGPNPAYQGDPFAVVADLRGRNEAERIQLSVHGRKDFDWGTVKSITSYQNWDFGPQTVDLDFTPFPLATSTIRQDQQLWTQEFRLQSAQGTAPFSWRGGLFYMHKDNRGSTRRQFPANPFDPFNSIVAEGNRFAIDQEIFAGYGKGAYDLGNGFSVEGGARVEFVEASMNRVKTLAPFGPVPILSPRADGIYVSPTAGIVYKANENLTAFVRSGLGVKPHGYSAFSDNPATAAFGEERNWSNEVGVQFTDAASKVNAVVRAFWNEIDDYQLNAQNPLSTDFVIVNADKVRSRGVEAELQWRPIDPLLLHGTAGFTDVEFDSYTDPFTFTNHDGNTVPFIPEFTASAGFRYDLPGGFFVGSSVRATQDTYYDPANTSAFSEGGYWVWDAQAGYEAEHWSVTVYGRNLLDEDYYNFINPQIAAGSPGDPQLFGVRVDVDLW